jgi:hypothetical protein
MNLIIEISYSVNQWNSEYNKIIYGSIIEYIIFLWNLR